MYLTVQLMKDQEKEELQKVFLTMDKNGDGKLSREELIDGYVSMGETRESAAKSVNNILFNLDIDKSGYIGYSEFLIAMANKKELLRRNNLKEAFDAFDKDKNGFIDKNEVKELLGAGREFSEKDWASLIRDVDANADGRISFDEFERMMDCFTK